jgi:hypothetical protein
MGDVYRYSGAQPAYGDRTRTLFGQTMGLVACTAGCFALGAYLGRHLSGAVAIVSYLAAFACLIGMRFAVRAGGSLTTVLLLAFGLLIGVAVAPTLLSYGAMDPRALWQAGGATALFIAGFGGQATSAAATWRRLPGCASLPCWP